MDPVQGNGGTSPSNNAQASPGSSPANQPSIPPEIQQRLTDLEKQASEGAKAQKDLSELQNYFTERQDLYQAALRYDKDDNLKQMVKSYIAGGGQTTSATQPSGKSEEPLDLSFLDDSQRQQLNSYIEKAIGSRLKSVDDTVSQLKGYVTQSQINDMRGKYTKEKGYPFNFGEVEGDIAAMINNGQAVSADSAYLQLVGSRYPTIRAETDKQIKEQKRQISMTNYRTPTNYPMKREGDGPKTFLDAIRQAQEQVGV